MKVAVTYENGEVFQHFGHSEAFKLYEVEGGEVKSSEVVPTNGSGHGALAGFLRERGVEVLICGGIGAGAQNALAEAGIKLYGGVSGSADSAVQALIEGNLSYNPDAMSAAGIVTFSVSSTVFMIAMMIFSVMVAHYVRII